MKRIKIGLLPLYIELYDDSFSDCRPRMDAFYSEIAEELRQRGLDVLTVPLCRRKSEFAAAIGTFEKAQAEGLVTLHLAYSPSLESAAALAATALPILVLDTTPTYDFGPRQDPAEIMYNHGIHGVQDMCNLLLRNGKPYRIEAGHWKESDVLERVTLWARSARLAGSMRAARVGRIGEPFEGMGDFAVEPDELDRTLGVETVPCDMQGMRRLVAKVTDAEVEAEMAENAKRCAAQKLKPEVHRRSVRAGLAVRRWIEKEALTAFTVNFLAIAKACG